MSFSQQGPRAICVLSANGAVSTATLRQPATSGGSVTYEVKHFFSLFSFAVSSGHTCLIISGKNYQIQVSYITLKIGLMLRLVLVI